MSLCITNLAALREYFADATKLGGKTLKQIVKENREILWTEEMSERWKILEDNLRIAAQKNLRNHCPNGPVLFFADASIHCWSAVVMQCSKDSVTVDDFRKMKPEPMIFLSGKFKSSQINWHISQKE